MRTTANTHGYSAGMLFNSTSPHMAIRGPRVSLSPDEIMGGATGGDNTQGNSGTGGSGDQTQDNPGPKIDAAAFWAEPAAESGGSPANPGSAESTPPAAGDQSGKTPAQLFMDRISAVQFGDAFSEAAVKKLEEGDLSGVNESIRQQMQHGLAQSVQLNAQLLKQAQESILAEVDRRVAAALGTEKNQDTLLSAFPAAKDPAMRPMIQQVFDQSLKHTKGNRESAVEMTKGMLKIMGKAGAADLGLDTPPGSSGDNLRAAESQSLIDHLLGR